MKVIIYVDKTQYIYELINSASYYFLSRPRRFGKSLLIDTISEVFKGDKELFKDLWIYESDYNFTAYPIIRLDMSNISNETPELLKETLLSRLKTYYDNEDFKLEYNITSDAFVNLIILLYKKHKKRVVVLIDEYDKPILDHLSSFEEADANRKVLKGFYGILKSMDPYLKFTFFTGVSKFTKISVFYELNNLMDITLTRKYSNICGITHEDLNKYFADHIKYLSQSDYLKSYDIYNEILKWYDGYSWDGMTKVINPFSLLSFFSQERFADFWFASGTPKFLMDLLRKKPEAYINLKNLKITELALDSSDIDNIDIEYLLFQSGYLTIKERLSDRMPEVYVLDMSNLEVREAFNLHKNSARKPETSVEGGIAVPEVWN